MFHKHIKTHKHVDHTNLETCSSYKIRNMQIIKIVIACTSERNLTSDLWEEEQWMVEPIDHCLLLILQSVQ